MSDNSSFKLPITAGIYIIRNKANAYWYVGSAVNLRKRWADHRSYLNNGKHHNPRLQSAWGKYGADSFSFEVIENVDNLALLLEAEQSWIDKLSAGRIRESYNFCVVAGSHLGRKRSPETRAKLSQAMKGKKHTDEAKAKMRDAKLGKKLSPDHLAKMAKTRSEMAPRKMLPEVVEEMRRLRRQGWTVENIALHLKLGATTLSRYLGEHERGRFLKVTSNQAAEICRLRADGVKLRVIATQFGISMSHVARIARKPLSGGHK